MAQTEKDLEIEGRTLRTQDVLDEAERIISLAHRHVAEMQEEGIKPNDLGKITQYRDMLEKEQQRLDKPPPKKDTLTREQQKLMLRCYQWRAILIHKVDRAFVEEPYNRIKYRRMLNLYRNPRRMYEELTVLYETAKLDEKRLLPVGIGEPFFHEGEDLRCLLMGFEPPDRKAWEEYKIKLANHRFGPPPQPPKVDMPELPEVLDTSQGLAIMRGRVFKMIREVSATGKAVFSTFEGREPRKYEAIRKEFELQILPSEHHDETVLSFADPEGPKRPKKNKKSKKSKTETKSRQPDQEAAETVEPPPKKEDPPKVLSNPGGPPPPPPDPLLKPPPRAVGLVRPSASRGRK